MRIVAIRLVHVDVDRLRHMPSQILKGRDGMIGRAK